MSVYMRHGRGVVREGHLSFDPGIRRQGTFFDVVWRKGMDGKKTRDHNLVTHKAA